jgi:EAL domain-containing protein (putative c-di-GMP-specific phosphodiesterase class I)
VVVFEDITERKRKQRQVERDLEKLAWVKRIREALSDDHFLLYAQPIIELSSRETVQRELLLRMRDGEQPDRTAVLTPGAFLPVAEEYGFILDIDRWVIDQAVKHAGTGLAVEVNLSGVSIGNSGMLQYIDNAINRSGADPAHIVFEITETALLQDEEVARNFVERLHAIGSKVALDDFGTGYGGFTYLKQLPVDYLKIDIEFVRDLARNTASRNVVEAIVNLARRFDLKTVAEGVEDAETLEMLAEAGVDYAQGYHIGRPAPLQESYPE